MENRKKLSLYATVATLVLLALVFVDVIPRDIGMPIVLFLLGVVNIFSGMINKADGRKSQGNLSIVIGVIILLLFVYQVVVLFI